MFSAFRTDLSRVDGTLSECAPPFDSSEIASGERSQMFPAILRPFELGSIAPKLKATRGSRLGHESSCDDPGSKVESHDLAM